MTAGRTEVVPDEVRAAATDVGVRVAEARQLMGGRAARTYRITTEPSTSGGPGDAILRIEDETGPTTDVGLAPPDHFELLRSLRSYDVRSPRPIGSGYISSGAYLMTEVIEGDVPSAWSRSGRELLGAEPLRSRLPGECAAVLRAIHGVPVGALRGVTAAAARPVDELDRWRRVLESTPFADDPLVRWCLFLVERDLPGSAPTTLVHGDFRLGNLVVRDGSLAGVLDWELASVGDPAVDLALLAAPPVAADWDRCGLDPVSAVLDRYLDGLPDAAEVQARLPASILLATLKVVSLWVNGARPTGGVVTADAARCGLNAVGARRYLARCLRPSYDSPPDLAAPRGPRATWHGRVEETLAAFKDEGGWERATLPPDLAVVPFADAALAARLVADAGRVAAGLGMSLDPGDDPLGAVASLVQIYAQQRGWRRDVTADATVEELVLRTLEPELTPRPW